MPHAALAEIESWLLTHQSAVAQWECDAMGHFTIGYYYQRLDLALAACRLLLSAPAEADIRGLWQARFVEELRSGDSFRIVSAALDPAGEGHVFVNADTGRPTTFVRRTAAEDRALTTAGERHPWPGPAFEMRPLPDGRPTLFTARSPLDAGTGLAPLIQLFTAASHVVLSAMGIDSGYLRRGDGGFSTFELALDVIDAPREPTLADIRSALVHVGRSSARMVHWLVDARTGHPYATLDQLGVHLDLAARRSAPFPDAMRPRIDRLVGCSGAGS